MKYNHIDFIYEQFNPILAPHTEILSSSFIYSCTLIVWINSQQVATFSAQFTTY
jgi:hypothetical protein